MDMEKAIQDGGSRIKSCVNRECSLSKAMMADIGAADGYGHCSEDRGEQAVISSYAGNASCTHQDVAELLLYCYACPARTTYRIPCAASVAEAH